MQNLKTLFLFTGLLFLIHQVNAQDPHRCSSDERMEQILLDQPEYQYEIQNKKKSMKNTMQQSQRMDVVTIPVHFIIVHPPEDAIGQGDNLSLDHVLSQLQVMNEDFRRLNPDAVNTPPEFAAADSEIEFCLATKDPNGNDTDGITRFATNDDFDNNEFSIKQQTGWPRETYLNVWVAPTIGALGYAYVPSINFLPNPTLDGVACRTSAFGDENFATHPVYNLGRTVTHEVGHYLGLGHIWAGDGCGGDDGFDDTPQQNDENFGCPNHPSPSCGNNGDMFMNYMDYVNDDCMNAFSADQNAYMHAVLNNSRSSLLNAPDIACSLAPAPLSAEFEVTDILCQGEETGSISMSVTGGTPEYEYSIDNVNFQTSNIFTDLPAGNYIGYVIDANLESFQLEFTIEQPDAIELFIADTGMPTCFGANDGFVVAEYFGGTPPYGPIEIDGSIADDNFLFEELSAGFHTVQVEDANGCIQFFEFELFEPEELFVELTAVEGIGCMGEPGNATGSAFGGTGEILYSLNGEDFSANQLFSDLAEGSYTIYAQDENGCVAENEFAIESYLPIAPEIDEVIPVSCFGDSDGSILLSATGGNGTLTYWLDGVESIDGSFSDLAVGTYQASVVDLNGCSTLVDFEIETPSALALESTALELPLCFGDATATISADGSGGTGQIEYSIDGLNFTIESIFAELTAGEYTITAQDENGCQIESIVSISEPDQLLIETPSTQNVLCFGDENGMAIVTAEGGTGVLTYSLDGIMFNTTTEFNDLAPGEYTAYTSDENGCIQNIGFTIGEPAELQFNEFDIAQLNCFGDSNGEILFNVIGGTGLPNVTLDGGQAMSSNQINFTQLLAGDYLIEAIDQNGCQISRIATVNQPDQIVVDLIDIEGDDGTTNGRVEILLKGGRPPYTIGETTFDPGEPYIIEDLESGEFDLIFTDANGCEMIVPIEIPMITTGINDQIIGQIRMFPNPASNEIRIDWPYGEMTSIELSTVNGVQILQENGLTHSDQIRIDLQSFVTGVYFVKLRLRDGQAVLRKLIVQK